MTQPSPNALPPDPGDGRERREFRRARLDLPITISLEDGSHEAKIRDVSRGGVCFFLDRPVPEMTALRVEFELPTEHGLRKITGDGAVVRCEKISRTLEHYEIAVFVQNMAEPDRATIEQYVAGIRG
ncbi:MAG: PilZ domain-containing protein [Planctomycetota bacterium]|nr:PilZ domain-containing protein [Planctomycetota bacterium]